KRSASARRRGKSPSAQGATAARQEEAKRTLTVFCGAHSYLASKAHQQDFCARQVAGLAPPKTSRVANFCSLNSSCRAISELGLNTFQRMKRASSVLLTFSFLLLPLFAHVNAVETSSPAPTHTANSAQASPSVTSPSVQSAIVAS